MPPQRIKIKIKKVALSRKINIVTFANLGSVRLPSLKFVGLRVRMMGRI